MRKQEIICPILFKTYLKNYENRDKRHPKNTKYDAIENFKGIVYSKKIKDSHCICFLFLLFVCLCVFVGLSSRKFFTQRIFKPMDFRADICGEFFLKDKSKNKKIVSNKKQKLYGQILLDGVCLLKHVFHSAL